MKKLNTIRNIIIATLLFIISSPTTLCAITQKQEQDMKVMRERVVNQLLEKCPDEATVKNYLDNIDITTGAWSDVDYKSIVGSDWKTKRHAERAEELAMYYVKYKSDSKTFTRKEVSDAIHAAWEYWFREKPYCTTNWFPNTIGCPMPLSHSFLIMQDEMSESECELAREVVFSKPTLSMTGANLVSLSDIVLTIAIFDKKPELLRDAVEALESTIYIAPNGIEGVQEDYSYHQHGPQVQFGNYGRAALGNYSKYAKILQNTDFAFDKEKMSILIDLIYEGYNWVLWGGYMDINSSGRQYGPDMLKMKGDDIKDCITTFSATCNNEVRTKLMSIVEENTDGNPVTRLGQKSFFCSDEMYHRTPTWGASLRMNSIHNEESDIPEQSLQYFLDAGEKAQYWSQAVIDKHIRVIASEQGSDNLKGYYVGDGAFYTYVDGDEYENSAVLWDWRKVPGITCYDISSSEPIIKPFNKIMPSNNSCFVGTCTDSKTGITTMIYHRDSIMAHKSWVVTDDFALCLGSDIKEERGEAALTTSIDQKLADGELLYLDKKWKKITNETKFKSGDRRFYHDKTGYISLDNAETIASVEYREGDWNDITRSIVPTKASGDVVSLYLRHSAPVDSYRYIILPARSKEEVAAFDLNAINIIQNDTEAVIVKYRDSYYITAFETIDYKSKDVSFKISTPGIFMIKKTANSNSWIVTAHDPTKRIPDTEFQNELHIL